MLSAVCPFCQQTGLTVASRSRNEHAYPGRYVLQFSDQPLADDLRRANLGDIELAFNHEVLHGNLCLMVVEVLYHNHIFKGYSSLFAGKTRQNPTKPDTFNAFPGFVSKERMVPDTNYTMC